MTNVDSCCSICWLDAALRSFWMSPKSPLVGEKLILREFRWPKVILLFWDKGLWAYWWKTACVSASFPRASVVIPVLSGRGAEEGYGQSCKQSLDASPFIKHQLSWMCRVLQKEPKNLCKLLSCPSMSGQNCYPLLLVYGVFGDTIVNLGWSQINFLFLNN